MNLALAATVLAGLLQAAASPPPRSSFVYPQPEGAAALEAGGSVQAAHFADHAALAAALQEALAGFRAQLGGATFGLDAGSGQPHALDPDLEAGLLDMLRKAPQLGEETREQGGLLTATFEFRPQRQPANANVYLRASWSAGSRRFELLHLVDPADAPLREDATGLHVEMP